jgi:hypothetical protein
MDAQALPDHTWITTYDSRKIAHKDIEAVVAAGEQFWYCWGLFRAKGAGKRPERWACRQEQYLASCLATEQRHRLKRRAERYFSMDATGSVTN